MKRTAATLCLVGACASAPPIPHVPVPQLWSQSPLPPPSAAETERAGSLWERFQSPELSALLKIADAQSFENAAAAARVAQQEALTRVARAPLYPLLSADLALSAQSSNSKSLGSIRGGFLDMGLTASYDVDLWGKTRAGIDAARATMHGSRYEREGQRLAVASGVTNTYFEILSLRERMTRATANLEATQRVLDVVEARARAGSALAREVAQQRGLVAAAEAQLEQLAAAEKGALITLAIASGREPTALTVVASDLDSIADPALRAIDLDVPKHLLSHRPDIASAEAALAASHADVAAVRAAFLPQLRLSAQAMYQYTFLSQYYDGSGLVYQGVFALSQPIFDGGLLNGQRDAAAARRSEAEVNYRRTVMRAIAEVESALAALTGVGKQYERQQTQVAEARRAFEFVQIEFNAGSADMLAVLDAQRTLIQSEDAFCQVRLGKLRAAVALVTALGAGWSKR